MACGCACSEEEEELDLEKGSCHGHTVAPSMYTPLQDAMKQENLITDDAQKSSLETASLKGARCIGRGLLVLLWVYLIDLFRRFVTTHSEGAWIIVTIPLALLAVSASLIIFFLMESMDELRPVPTTGSE